MDDRSFIALTRVCAVYVYACAALALEWLAADFGLLLPAGLFVTFYVARTYGWRPAVLAGLLTGFCADVLLGRAGWSLLLVPLLLPALRWYEHSADRRSPAAQALLGALAGGLYAIAAMVAGNLRLWPWHSYVPPLTLLLDFAVATVTAALLFPALTLVFDWLQRQAELDLDRRFAAQPGEDEG